MSDTTISMTSELRRYLLDNSLRETKILERLRLETEQLPGAMMQISPEQGQFFTFLLKILHAKKTIDIGTFTGYSALIAALAISEEGRVISCDINTDSTQVAQRYWVEANVAHKIDLKIGRAEETLTSLIADEKGTFDFIFIDADKQSYPRYYELSLELLKPGGVIAIDNVLWSGQVIDASDHSANTEMFRKFNANLHQDHRVFLSMLPIGDGLTLALKL